METIHHYVGVIRRWWLLILIGALLGTVGAYAFTVRQTPLYRSSALLMVDNVENPVAPNYQDVQMNQKLTDTYAERLTSRAVLEAVANEVGSGLTPGALRGSVTATPLLETSLIRLNVVDTDPARAVAIANKVAEVFNEHNQSLQEAQFAELRGRYSDQLAAIDGDIKNTQTQIRQIGDASTPENQVLLDQLQANLSAYRSNYSALLDKYGELRLAEASRRASLTVDQPATLPRVPFSPNVQRNTILGGIAGLAIVLAIATVLSYFDDTIRTREDLPGAINADQLVPQAPIRAINANGMTAPTLLVTNDSASTELVRYLTRLIQYNEHGPVSGPMSLLFANPSGGGDTGRLIADVASRLAQAGWSVLAIDFDLDNASLHAALGMRPAAGLAEALRDVKSGGTTRVDDYLSKAAQPNLKVLFAGEKQDDDNFELSEIRRLMGLLSQDVDVMLLKGPAVLDNSLSMYLAQMANGILLIADAGQTRRRDIAESVRRLEEVGARVLGTVLYRPRSSTVENLSSYNASS